MVLCKGKTIVILNIYIYIFVFENKIMFLNKTTNPAFTISKKGSQKMLL